MTESSSVSTGALKVAGGLAVAKNIFSGGIIDAQGFKINGIDISAGGGSAPIYCLGVTPGTASNGKVLALDDNGAISGILSLTANSITGQLQTAEQPNVTSLGTLLSLNVDGSIIFNSTTDASNSTTAGVKTAGGLAVAKKLYVGTGIYGTVFTSSQANITTVGTLTALAVSGVSSLTNNTDATAATNGALVVSGGVGIGKNLYVGQGIDGTLQTEAQPNITSVGTLSSLSVTGALSAATLTGTLQTAAQPTITSVGTLTSLNVSGSVSLSSITDASGALSGALQIAGGVGIAKKLHVGGGINGALQTATQPNITSIGTLSSLTVTNGVSAATLTGALQTAAQPNITSVGTLSSLNVSGVGSFSSLTVNGNAITGSSTAPDYVLSITAGTASASKALVLDSSSSISGISSLTSAKLVASGTTASTSTTTGALVVAGGAGIGGDTYIGGQILLGSTSTSNPRALTIPSFTFTNSTTAANNTNANFRTVMHFSTPTLAATNTGVTTNNAATIYINSAPVAGTNMSITNSYALFVNAGRTRLGGDVNVYGSIGVGTSTPGCTLDLGATANDRTIALYNNGSSFYGFGANNSCVKISTAAGLIVYSGSTSTNTGIEQLKLTTSLMTVTPRGVFSSGVNIGDTTDNSSSSRMLSMIKSTTADNSSLVTCLGKSFAANNSFITAYKHVSDGSANNSASFSFYSNDDIMTIACTKAITIGGSLSVASSFNVNSGNAYFGDRIGIRTTDPQCALHVMGFGTDWASIQRCEHVGSRVDTVINTNTGEAFIGTTTNHQFSLATNNSRRFFVHGDGSINMSSSLAVNTTSPIASGYKCEINGSLLISGTTTTWETTGAYGYVNGGGSGKATGGTGGPQQIGIRVSSGRILCDGEIDALSDYRVKQDIEPLDTTFAKNFILGSSPVKYKYKSNASSDKFVYGFIAQDFVKNDYYDLYKVEFDESVEEVIEQDGFVNPKGALFSINYNNIIPLLTLSKKNTYSEVDELKQEVASLKDTIALMQQQLQQLLKQ